MGQKNERIVGLNANHRQICKFGEAHDANYNRVLSRLEATLTVIKDSCASLEGITAPVELEGQSEDAALHTRFEALRE